LNPAPPPPSLAAIGHDKHGSLLHPQASVYFSVLFGYNHAHGGIDAVIVARLNPEPNCLWD